MSPERERGLMPRGPRDLSPKKTKQEASGWGRRATQAFSYQEDSAAVLSSDGLPEVRLPAVLLKDEGPQRQQSELALDPGELLRIDAGFRNGSPFTLLVQRQNELLEFLGKSLVCPVYTQPLSSNGAQSPQGWSLPEQTSVCRRSSSRRNVCAYTWQKRKSWLLLPRDATRPLLRENVTFCEGAGGEWVRRPNKTLLYPETRWRAPCKQSEGLGRAGSVALRQRPWSPQPGSPGSWLSQASPCFLTGSLRRGP